MLRFHLDENVDHALYDALCRREIDVTTALSTGLTGVSDSEQIEFARKSDRVIVTHDADYLRLAAKGVPHAGIAYCQFRSRTLGEMLRALLLLCEEQTPEEMFGRVCYLS